MVLPPTAILGAITTCEGILKEIYGILAAIKDCPKDVKKIRESFNLSNDMLPRFFRFFKAEEENIPKDINDSIANITVSLNTKLEYLTRKLKAKRDGASWRRFVWYWAKDDFAGVEQELGLWVIKVHHLAQCLHPDLRTRLYNEFASEKFLANSPLTALLAGLKMRTRLDEDEHRKLEDFSLMGDVPPHAPDSIQFIPDKWGIPGQYARQLDEQKRIELDVARLVSLLNDSDASRMHLPKANLYTLRTFTSEQLAADGTEPVKQTFTTALEIHYESPTDVISITSLKEAIENNTKHVRS